MEGWVAEVRNRADALSARPAQNVVGLFGENKGRRDANFAGFEHETVG